MFFKEEGMTDDASEATTPVEPTTEGTETSTEESTDGAEAPASTEM
jgi:hypothetical protein